MHADAVALKPELFTRGVESRKCAQLPGLNDAYKASAHPASGEVGSLVLIMGKDGFKLGATAYHIMQYVHIGLGEFGFEADGQVFRFLFSDLQPKLVTVRGRNLLRICDYIGLRRIAVDSDGGSGFPQRRRGGGR